MQLQTIYNFKTLVINMPRNKFNKKFSDEDFLNALSETEQKTAGYIVLIVKCTLPTAYTYLEKLAVAGLVKKVPIDEGNSFVWLKVAE